MSLEEWRARLRGSGWEPVEQEGSPREADVIYVGNGVDVLRVRLDRTHPPEEGPAAAKVRAQLRGREEQVFVAKYYREVLNDQHLEMVEDRHYWAAEYAKQVKREIEMADRLQRQPGRRIVEVVDVKADHRHTHGDGALRDHKSPFFVMEELVSFRQYMEYSFWLPACDAGRRADKLYELQPRLLRLGRDIVRGLSQARALAKGAGWDRWYHRDLKPENVLVRVDGDDAVAVIADLNSAALREVGERTATPRNAPVGTHGWNAPEVVAAGNTAGAASPASDTYAVGLILLWAWLQRGNPHPKADGGFRHLMPSGSGTTYVWDVSDPDLDSLLAAQRDAAHHKVLMGTLPRPLRTVVSACLHYLPEERPSWDQLDTLLTLVIGDGAASPSRPRQFEPLEEGDITFETVLKDGLDVKSIAAQATWVADRLHLSVDQQVEVGRAVDVGLVLPLTGRRVFDPVPTNGGGLAVDDYDAAAVLHGFLKSPGGQQVLGLASHLDLDGSEIR